MSEPIEHVTAHAVDDWECVCGNRPHLDGFYAYTDGREVEPVAGQWDGVHYFCLACGRIINATTLEVVDQRANIPTLE